MRKSADWGMFHVQAPGYTASRKTTAPEYFWLF